MAVTTGPDEGAVPLGDGASGGEGKEGEESEELSEHGGYYKWE